jgi:hypothetical protein
VRSIERALESRALRLHGLACALFGGFDIGQGGNSGCSIGREGGRKKSVIVGGARGCVNQWEGEGEARGRGEKGKQRASRHRRSREAAIRSALANPQRADPSEEIARQSHGRLHMRASATSLRRQPVRGAPLLPSPLSLLPSLVSSPHEIPDPPALDDVVQCDDVHLAPARPRARDRDRLCLRRELHDGRVLGAFRIPNFMRRLFAEGSFSTAFVPVFTEGQAHASRTPNSRPSSRASPVRWAACC